LSLWFRRTLVIGAIYIVILEGYRQHRFRDPGDGDLSHPRPERDGSTCQADWSSPGDCPVASTCLIGLLSVSALFAALGA
jgi:hypothetical protein